MKYIITKLNSSYEFLLTFLINQTIHIFIVSYKIEDIKSSILVKFNSWELLYDIQQQIIFHSNEIIKKHLNFLRIGFAMTLSLIIVVKTNIKKRANNLKYRIFIKLILY